MAVIRIRSTDAFALEAKEAYELHRARVLDLLPEAVVEHVGATAVPGALTKGDVDLVVRVSAQGFSAASEALTGSYAIHQPDNWTSTLASFSAPEAGAIPVGVQLVVAGSADGAFVEAVQARLRTPLP